MLTFIQQQAAAPASGVQDSILCRRNIRETGSHPDEEEQEPHDEEADVEKNRVTPGTSVMHLCMACTGSSLVRKTAANSTCYASFAQKTKTGDHKSAIRQLERSPYHRNNVPDMRHSVAFL